MLGKFKKLFKKKKIKVVQLGYSPKNKAQIGIPVMGEEAIN